MRKLVLAAAAAMLAGQVEGQTPSATPKPPPGDMWVYVRFADGAMGWNLQAGRWFDNNDTTEGQRLVYYAEPQDVDGVKIVWAQEFWRIKCKANTYQIKSGEELTAGLGTAFKLNAGEPVPIQEGTTEWVLKRVYCDNVEFDSAQHVTGIIEAMDGMRAPAQ
jgi:hypothetical protein